MSWKHCRVHGRYQSFDGTRGCPDCLEDVEDAREHREQEAERRSEELGILQEAADERAAQIEEARERERERKRRHDELVHLRREEIYRQSNPGDYRCPICKFKTLEREAECCPKCQKAVPLDYWPPILERERTDAEERERLKTLAAEEWAKGEPERQRQAKTAVAERERKRRVRQSEPPERVR